MEASINGGPFNHVTPDTGYTPPDDDGREGIRAFIYQDGYGAASGGVVTGVVTLDVAEGDTVRLRWNSGWFGEEPVRFPDWRLHSASVDTGGAAADGAVVDRSIVYNNSFFDGDDAAVNAEDDNAIATDKTVLLPGETATFANYTSYAHGINAVSVDVTGFAEQPTLATVDDFFAFSVGNDDTPDAWDAAPAPSDVVVRAGGGVDGSDRVTVLWEDNAIQNQWLQVTLQANATTALAEPDVFYVGNAIGESGNSATDTQVNAQDIGGARDNPHNFLNRAEIDDAFDYNRDSLVNAQDIGVSRDNPTNFLTDLNLITAPAVAPVAGAVVTTIVEEQSLPIPLTVPDEPFGTGPRRGGSETRGVLPVATDLQHSGLLEAHTAPLDGQAVVHEASQALDWNDLDRQDDFVELLAEDQQSL